MPYYEFKPIKLDDPVELGHELIKALEQPKNYQDARIARKWKRILLPMLAGLSGASTGLLTALICKGYGTMENMGFMAFISMLVFIFSVMVNIICALNWSDEWSRILADDRFKLVQSLLEDIRVWNQEVVLFNRLLDQIDLELIGEVNPEDVINRLRGDEKFLRAKIEYTRRRLKESPLGQPLIQSLPTVILDDTDDWRERVRDHRRELENTAGRMLARYEVEAALKRP